MFQLVSLSSLTEHYSIIQNHSSYSAHIYQPNVFPSSGQMCAHIVVVYELAEAPPAGPSTHSFLQGNWCVCVVSLRKEDQDMAHGLHNKTHTQPGRFSATRDKWCTAHIEPCSTDATNFLISCGGMYQVQTIIQLPLFSYQLINRDWIRGPEWRACSVFRFGKQFLNGL